MISGITNIGIWQCVDIGIWQSGCYYIIPNCGKFGSSPLVTGQAKSEPVVTGTIETKPKVIGVLKTPICGD